jgi:hypothetical protein
MYEVGPWFVGLMDLAVLAIVALVVLVYIQIRRNQYRREAHQCIQVEILLSTGHSEFHTVKCGISDEWVEIEGIRYKLDKEIRRWGSHPRLPFMGLSTLQCDIRKEMFHKDDPNSIYRAKGTPDTTGSEIDAMVRAAAAVAAGAEAVEMQSRQKQMVEAIANQPNKNIVYALLIAADIGLIALAVRLFQMTAG